MSDVLFIILTVAAFASLAVLAGVLDRSLADPSETPR